MVSEKAISMLEKKMIEHEYKYEADKNDINRAINNLKSNKNVVALNRFVQINYYYDTKDLFFQSQEITIRIRQKEDNLKLQIKKKNYYGEHKNLEIETEIKYIPDNLMIENKETDLMGHLVTDRTRYIFNNGINLDLDINFYCGVVDYEIEVELPEGMNNVKTVLPWVDDLIPAKIGKATRFYRAKNMMGDK